MKRALAILLGLAAATTIAPGHAQGTPYYAGKTIEIIVPFSPGGGIDMQWRFLAPFFEKHVAGKPRVVVRNMPGGGGILGANFFAASAKPDGLQLLAPGGAASAIPYILGMPQVRYAFGQWRLVAVSSGGGVIFTAPRTRVRKPEDLRNPAEPLVYGGISPVALDLAVLLVIELFEVKARAVFGFEGRGPALLAFERGETTMDYQTTPAYLAQVVPLVREGKAIPLMSFGFTTGRGQLVRDPAAPDLPTVYEVYQRIFKRKPDGLLRWKALQVLLIPGFTYQKPLWAPQGTPGEALRALQEAVDGMKADPQFLAQGRTVLEGYPIFRGDQVETAVHRAMRITLDVQRFIRDLLRTKYGVDI